MYFINERIFRRRKIQTVNTIYHHSSGVTVSTHCKSIRDTRSSRVEKWIFVLIHARACRIHRSFYTNGNFNASNAIIVVVVVVAVAHCTFVGVFDQFYSLVYPRSVEYLFIVAIIAIPANHRNSHPDSVNAFSWFSRINRFTYYSAIRSTLMWRQISANETHFRNVHLA